MPKLPELFERRRAWLVTTGWALSAIGFASFGHFLWLAILRDGGAAYDLHAYILAGRNLLEGAPLYGPMEINDPGAFRYPPTFAALAAPLALPPEPLVTWLYRAACLACVRYLVGSWRATGWALLVVPVQIELVALNVTLPIAASARMALRGSMTGWGVALLPLTAALKFGTVLLLPYLWLTRGSLRGPLVAACVTTGAIFATHAALDPATWRAYVGSLGQQAASLNDAGWVGDQLLFLVPSTLGDFVLRLAIGSALVALAVRWRADWLAYAAAAIAVPTLWVARLAALAAVPRLVLEGAARTDGRVDREADRTLAAEVALGPILDPGASPAPDPNGA